jgi:O-antigen/teichoic acid export membrane protein
MSASDSIWTYLDALNKHGARIRISALETRNKLARLVARQRGFFALCDQGVVSLTNFATGVIIGRVCGKAELGIYTLAWTLLAMATGISSTLTSTPYAVFGPLLVRSRQRRYLGSIFVHQVVISGIFALVLVVGAALGSWQRWFSGSISTVLITVAGIILFIGLRDFVRGVSFAELRIGSALVVDVAACLVQGVGILLLVHFGALTTYRTYILLGFASAAAAGGWMAFRWQAFRIDARLCALDGKRNWRFAKWVLGSGFLGTIAMFAYPWLLAAFHGTAVTGTWAACAAIVAIGNPVLLGLSNYVGPKIHNVYASSGTATMQRSVYSSSLLFTGLLLPFVLVLACYGERIIVGVYGKSYAGTAGVILLLALNMVISAMSFPFSRGLFSLDCAKADMMVNIVTVALLFTVGIALAKSYSLFGAGAALLGSTTITTAIRIGVFAREVRRHT